MAQFYRDWCIYCEEQTQWVRHDLEPGRLDNCTKCSKDIFAQNAACNRRAAKKRARR